MPLVVGQESGGGNRNAEASGPGKPARARPTASRVDGPGPEGLGRSGQWLLRFVLFGSTRILLILRLRASAIWKCASLFTLDQLRLGGAYGSFAGHQEQGENKDACFEKFHVVPPFLG